MQCRSEAPVVAAGFAPAAVEVAEEEEPATVAAEDEEEVALAEEEEASDEPGGGAGPKEEAADAAGSPPVRRRSSFGERVATSRMPSLMPPMTPAALRRMYSDFGDDVPPPVPAMPPLLLLLTSMCDAWTRTCGGGLMIGSATITCPPTMIAPGGNGSRVAAKRST